MYIKKKSGLLKHTLGPIMCAERGQEGGGRGMPEIIGLKVWSVEQAQHAFDNFCLGFQAFVSEQCLQSFERRRSPPSSSPLHPFSNMAN